jgi:YtfJ family uncharacterized protein
MGVDIMKSTRMPSLALVASVALLFQSAVLAVEHTGVQVSKADQLLPELDGKDGSHRFDGKTDVSLQPGQSLPVLEIQAGGEISVSDNSVVKTPWSSKSFESKGKVQLVQYIAANRGAARQNKPFTDSLIEKRFTSEQLSTTVIVHMADTMSLVKGIVVNKIAKNKVKHQTINFVIDDNGVGLQRWGMKNKSYAIIVLDAGGKVLFAKDGPLSEVEIKSTIDLIEKQMS